MSILVTGATGTLGRQIVKEAINQGYKVKCLVRNFRKSGFLLEWGAELVYGDLSIPETLPSVFEFRDSSKFVKIVIDAATIRPTDNYNAEKVDWQGKLALLETVKLANIKKFISFSVINTEKCSNVVIADLKIKFEKRLRDSGLNFTIFSYSGFFQGLITQYAIPILEKEKVWLLRGDIPLSYVNTQDAANLVIKSLSTPKSDYKIFCIISQKHWTSKEIIELCERLSGEKAQLAYLPFIAIELLSKFFRFLKFTWNIADRLQFSEFLKPSPDEVRVINNFICMDNYHIFIEFCPVKKQQFLQLLLTLESKIIYNYDKIIFQPLEFLLLEQYLQEYFSQFLRKLKEMNYQQNQRNKDISFF